MATRYKPKDLKRIFAEMDGQNDRAIITVGASLLAHAVEELLGSRLREPKTSKERDVLFTDFGILGTFSEQIWMAYFMSLIGPKTRHDLDMVRIIRNICAHDMNPISFEQKEVSSRCFDLHTAKRALEPNDEHTAKERFTTTIYILTASVAIRAVDHVDEEFRKLQLVKYLDE